jgi:hypothetical protein
MKKEWEVIEGMPHLFNYMSTLRIIVEGEYQVLQMLNFYSGGWTPIHKINRMTEDNWVQRLKDYANKIFRLEYT